METQTLIGTCIIFCGLGFILYLTFRSRRIIQKIADQKKEKSSRDLLRDLHNGSR